MERWGVIFAAALFVPPPAARAAPIALPLPHDAAMVSPRFHTMDLAPKTAHAVKAAIRAARAGRRSASSAEKVIQAALAAGTRAGNARGYGSLDMPGADGTACLYQGQLARGRATGLGVMHCRGELIVGRFRDGRLNGQGGDTLLGTADAYEGAYRNGARIGFGIERDKDGVYPGLYGLRPGSNGKRTDMEVLGLQDFETVHWAGHYGSYAGPKIACSLIQGAFLEGSVLDGYGAKFDAHGMPFEQGFYRLGRLARGSAPPC